MMRERAADWILNEIFLRIPQLVYIAYIRPMLERKKKNKHKQRSRKY